MILISVSRPDVQDYKNVGLQVVQLSTERKGLLVITSAGASLGADVELLVWRQGLGFVNVFPADLGGGHEVHLATMGGSLRMTISYTRRAEDLEAHHPVTLEWDKAADQLAPVGGR